MVLSGAVQPRWHKHHPCAWSQDHFTATVIHIHLSSLTILKHNLEKVKKKKPHACFLNCFTDFITVYRGRKSCAAAKIVSSLVPCWFHSCMHTQTERRVQHAQRPSRFHPPVATTPSLLPTLQLARLKVVDFRGQAPTNHRYALLCSAARALKISTSWLSHTSCGERPATCVCF